MFYIVMAVIGELTFMVFRILEKRLRNGGAQTLAILASYGLTMPVWLVIIGGFAFLGMTAFTPAYGLVIAAWLATCFFINFGSVYLTKFQSMSEGVGYRFGFTLLLSLLADIFIFSIAFDAEKLLALSMLFGGGIALHFSRQKNIAPDMRMALPKRLGIIFVLAVAEVATYTLFKHGASLQASPTFHNALSQFLLFSIFVMMGHKAFAQDRKEGKLPTMYLIGLTVLLIIACLAAGLALAALPLTLLITISLMRPVFYAIHDIKTKELTLSLTNSAAITVIIGGLVYMAYLNHNV
jgi:hypothetical protein